MRGAKGGEGDEEGEEAEKEEEGRGEGREEGREAFTLANSGRLRCVELVPQSGTSLGNFTETES